MNRKIRAVLTGIGSLVDLDGRTTREQASNAADHPFAERCPHGVQFLDECEQCPNGWQPRSEWDDSREDAK